MTLTPAQRSRAQRRSPGQEATEAPTALRGDPAGQGYDAQRAHLSPDAQPGPGAASEGYDAQRDAVRVAAAPLPSVRRDTRRRITIPRSRAGLRATLTSVMSSYVHSAQVEGLVDGAIGGLWQQAEPWAGGTAILRTILAREPSGRVRSARCRLVRPRPAPAAAPAPAMADPVQAEAEEVVNTAPEHLPANLHRIAQRIQTGRCTPAQFEYAQRMVAHIAGEPYYQHGMQPRWLREQVLAAHAHLERVVNQGLPERRQSLIASNTATQRGDWRWGVRWPASGVHTVTVGTMRFQLRRDAPWEQCQLILDHVSRRVGVLEETIRTYGTPAPRARRQGPEGGLQSPDADRRADHSDSAVGRLSDRAGGARRPSADIYGRSRRALGRAEALLSRSGPRSLARFLNQIGHAIGHAERARGRWNRYLDRAQRGGERIADAIGVFSTTCIGVASAVFVAAAGGGALAAGSINAGLGIARQTANEAGEHMMGEDFDFDEIVRAGAIAFATSFLTTWVNGRLKDWMKGRLLSRLENRRYLQSVMGTMYEGGSIAEAEMAGQIARLQGHAGLTGFVERTVIPGLAGDTTRAVATHIFGRVWPATETMEAEAWWETALAAFEANFWSSTAVKRWLGRLLGNLVPITDDGLPGEEAAATIGGRLRGAGVGLAVDAVSAND